MNSKQKVLLLGSGLMAETVVRYLLRRPQNHIHIASNILADAAKIANLDISRCTFSELEVQNESSLGPLVQATDLTISYVPAFLHIHVAKQCLKHGKNLVTASYVAKQMRELEDQVKAKGLLFLNELGLDPGIDHMSTMKVVDEVRAKGGKILQYESWCGGLPSPQCCDNPLGYKFTWSPIGALRAVKNNAKYILEDKQHTVSHQDLLYSTSKIEINPALSLEGYPNRDSTSYRQFYKLNDCHKVLRGTLRYKGFCTVINAFKEVGLFSQEIITAKTWLQYLNILLQHQVQSSIDENLVNLDVEKLAKKIATAAVYKIKNYQKLTKQQKNCKVKEIIKAFKFFGLLDSSIQIQKPGQTNLENLVLLLEKKLKLKAGQSDLIAMQHIFKIQYPNQKPYVHKSSLILIGDKHGLSGMSLTVGTPTAIGAQMILDKKIKLTGIVIPTVKQIYEPILEELGKCGIILKQEDE